MFLENLLNSKSLEGVEKFAKESCTYNFVYKYWRDVLFERVYSKNKDFFPLSEPSLGPM